MKKQLSSLDIYFALNELKKLENSKIDKIRNNGKEEIYLQLHNTHFGKIILRLVIGKSLFITKTRISDKEPSHFCMILRKHLEGKTLNSIKQLESERILLFSFKSKDEIKKLYIEIFAKGNVILTQEDDVIINSLTKHKFRFRTILPKHKYKYPNMEYNLFDLKINNLVNLFKKNEKDKLVTTLAVGLGLGGVYSEEVCLLSNIDKNKDPKILDNNSIQKIFESIKKIINKKLNSQIIYKNAQSESGIHSLDKEAIDIVPINLELYKNNNKKDFSSFNEALEHYFTKEIQLIRKESPYHKEISKIKRIIDEHFYILFVNLIFY